MTAVLVMYCVVAYVGIPLLLRVVRFTYDPQRIPLYSVTPDGLPCDPVNLCLVGTEAEVKQAMIAAGWFEADRRTPFSVAKMALAIVLHRRYVHAPFGTLYLLKRPQDFGFQIPVSTSPLKRHHIRFWRIDPNEEDEHGHINFWRSLSERPKRKQPMLWLAAATYDRGIGIALHTGQIDHMIHGDTNAERDYVLKTLQTTSAVASVMPLKAGEPYTLRNRVFGVRVIADGEVTLIHLRRRRADPKSHNSKH